MRLSVIVPAYNAEATLQNLLDPLFDQKHGDFEVIVVDDCSRDTTPLIAQSYRCALIRLKENHGPAYCRNLGARNAGGDILVFTDSDCMPCQGWLDHIQRHFSEEVVDAIMGAVVVPPSNLIGDSISALGFPAGGDIGFDKIWKVDRRGFTDSLSSCNCAIRKDVFWEAGGFDESFPYPGGEDSLLAYALKRLNYRIKYCPDVIVRHSARNSIGDFLKWQFRRGISSFVFSRKISNRKDYVTLRFWSTANILRRYCRERKFPLVLVLLLTSLYVQLAGFISAKFGGDFDAGSDH